MSQLVLCISLCPAVTSSSWHFQAEKKLHSTIRLFKLSDYSKRGHWLPAWVSPRKFSLPITLLILGKCTWAGCTESALFCSSQSFFFLLCMCCMLEEELKWENGTLHLGVAPQPCTGGGGPWAGVAQLWCISCGPLRAGEKLILTECSWLACFLTYLCNSDDC